MLKRFSTIGLLSVSLCFVPDLILSQDITEVSIEFEKHFSGYVLSLDNFQNNPSIIYVQAFEKIQRGNIGLTEIVLKKTIDGGENWINFVSGKAFFCIRVDRQDSETVYGLEGG